MVYNKIKLAGAR